MKSFSFRVSYVRKLRVPKLKTRVAMFENEFDYLFSMLYVVSALFGTWPFFFKIESVDKMNNLTKAKSWIRLYWMLTFWIFLAIINHIYYVHHLWKSSLTFSSSISKISKYDIIVRKLNILENWTINLTTIINIVVTYFTSKNIPIILRKFEITEKQLKTFAIFNDQVVRRLRRSEFFKNILWIISIYTSIVLTMITEYFGFLPLRDTNFTASSILQNLGELSMMTLDLQFFMFCRQLKYKFQIVDYLLRGNDKSEGNEENETTSTAVSTARIFPKSRMNNFLSPRHRFRDSVKVRYLTTKSIIHQINSMHADLCEIVETLKKTYQLQIATNLIVCFFITVCVLFTTISEYGINNDSSLWIKGGLRVTYYLIRSIMVCISAGQAIDKAYAPKTFLSCIDSRKLNENEKCQVTQFLNRLKHTDIEFTMCGLITLNTSLLSSAGLGIITYLVIGLQYSYT